MALSDDQEMKSATIAAKSNSAPGGLRPALACIPTRSVFMRDHYYGRMKKHVLVVDQPLRGKQQR